MRKIITSLNKVLKSELESIKKHKDSYKTEGFPHLLQPSPKN